jgi:pimeloyl-ACP methyl ester carboxylesterase
VAHDAKPNISVPTILIYGEKDGGALPATIIGDQKNFTGTYEQILLPEVGHFVTHEDPTSVVNIILRGTQAASR